MKKSYCSSRHNILIGLGTGIKPNLIKCSYCGTNNDSQSWYCNNCYRCLDCQRIIKSKFDDPVIAAIKPLAKFEHSRNLVRTYCFRHNDVRISNSKFETIVSGADLVNEVMNGNLDLLGDRNNAETR